MQNLGRSTVRVVKNYTKGYSDTQTKVRDATSNDPWGPSGTQMNEIAQLTYNHQDFIEIMEMLDKRLNDKGKNWRHVFKSLTLLDYCLHAGDDKVVQYFQKNMYIIKTLKEFQFVDETGKDQGQNVRQKAKDITNLLQDESRLREERRSRAHMRDRMTYGPGMTRTSFDDSPAAREPYRRPTRPNENNNNEDAELRAAIEASKRTAEDEAARLKREAQNDNELEEAIRLSREEEEKRRREQENSTANALFDDSFSTPTNNAYANQNNQQQDLLVDIGLPQNQQTLAPQYTAAVPQQQFAMQPQYTSMNPYLTGVQPQMTGNPYLQPQFTAYGMNPQQQQQDEWNRQQEMLRLQQQQQQQQQQPLRPQHTAIGSNNPFAQFNENSTPATSSSMLEPSSAALSNLNAPSPMSSNQGGTPVSNNNQTQSLSPSPSQQPQPSTQQPSSNPTPFSSDGRHDMLAAALQNRDDAGIDTFGNIGNLRYGTSNPFKAQQATNGQQQGGDTTSNASPFFSV